MPPLERKTFKDMLQERIGSRRRFVRAGANIFFGPAGENDPSNAEIYYHEMRKEGITTPIDDAGRISAIKSRGTIFFSGSDFGLGIFERGNTKRDETVRIAREIAGPDINIEKIQ